VSLAMARMLAASSHKREDTTRLTKTARETPSVPHVGMPA
jgi:hypothetical protein